MTVLQEFLNELKRSGLEIDEESKIRFLEKEKSQLFNAVSAGFNQAHYSILHPESFEKVECEAFCQSYIDKVCNKSAGIIFTASRKSWSSIEKKYGKYIKKRDVTPKPDDGCNKP